MFLDDSCYRKFLQETSASLEIPDLKSHHIQLPEAKNFGGHDSGHEDSHHMLVQMMNLCNSM